MTLADQSLQAPELDFKSLLHELDERSQTLEGEWNEFKKEFEVVENLRRNNQLSPEVEEKLYLAFAEAAQSSKLPLSFLDDSQKASSSHPRKKFHPKI